MGIIGILLVIALIFIAINVVQWGFGILFAVIVWAISGAIASRLMGGDGAGLLGNLLLGIIGGAVGSLILDLLNIPLGSTPLIGGILVGLVGAVITIFVVRALTGNRAFGR